MAPLATAKPKAAALDSAFPLGIKCLGRLESGIGPGIVIATQTQHNVEYRCPGESYAISRAVHLGRLARFYPGCRRCAHRRDTATLSARQREQLAETESRGTRRALFFEEGAGGVYLNDLGPETAGRLAAAMGVFLRQRGAVGDASCNGAVGDASYSVVVAGDGRPMSCELVAAVAEGLRWAGCNVVDVGPSSAACLAFAVDHLGAAGAVLLGNPSGRPHTVGLKFWCERARPLSSGGTLEPLEQIYGAGLDRPGRRYGPLRRFRAEVPYLAALTRHYHALRPLRFVLATCCAPVFGYVDKLLESVACRSIPARAGAERLPEQVRREEAHFGVHIGDDGETCTFFDQRGQRVPAERMILLLAGSLLRETPASVVVLEEGTPAQVVAGLEAAGARVLVADRRRAQVQRAMRDAGGIFAAGPGGRFWHQLDGAVLPDALTTLTLLLVLLSRSDRLFSEVLDRDTL